MMLEQISNHGIILKSLHQRTSVQRSTQRTHLASRESFATYVAEQLETTKTKYNDPHQDNIREILKESILSSESTLRIRPPRDASPPMKNFSSVTKFELYCRVFRFEIPLGIVLGNRSVRRRAKQTFKKVTEENNWKFDIIFHPLPALTDMVFRLIIEWSSNGAFSFKPRRHGYNHNAELLRCLNRGDISNLCNLFSEGLASPDDLISPWGNSLLHVSTR